MQEMKINTNSDQTLLETETLPSAKFFAECQKSGTRQRIALGKKNAIDKGLLCRVPDSRQKRGARNRMTRVMVFGHVLLCRVPAVRHSAKFFLNFFAECPRSGTRQRFKFFFNFFAECPRSGTRQFFFEKYFAECP